jgi:hypothetical protein
MQFYCVKCRTKRNVKEADVKICRVNNKAGAPGTRTAKGQCGHCGITMCRFVKASKSPKARRCTNK